VRVNSPTSLLSRVTRYSGHVDGRIMSLTGGEVRCVLVPAPRAAVLGREGAEGIKIALFVELCRLTVNLRSQWSVPGIAEMPYSTLP